MTPERAVLVEGMAAAAAILGAIAAGGAWALPRVPRNLEVRLHVRIEGAVERPGAYSLPLGTDAAGAVAAAQPRFGAAAEPVTWALEEGDDLYVDREGGVHRNPWRRRARP